MERGLGGCGSISERGIIGNGKELGSFLSVSIGWVWCYDMACLCMFL